MFEECVCKCGASGRFCSGRFEGVLKVEFSHLFQGLLLLRGFLSRVAKCSLSKRSNRLGLCVWPRLCSRQDTGVKDTHFGEDERGHDAYYENELEYNDAHHEQRDMENLQQNCPAHQDRQCRHQFSG